MAAAVLSRRALNRATLARQMLLDRAPLAPVVALEQLAGLQAQVPRPPFVGLWTRLAAFERADLVTAIGRREVVRGTMMRGTLHLMSRRDYCDWRPAIQPALTRGMMSAIGKSLAALDTDGLLAASRAFFERAPCTFADLRGHLQDRYPTINERVAGYFVKMQLPLVQVPAATADWAYRTAADFALAETWIGEPLSSDSRPQAMALRYFAAFGPSSAKDFQIWSGLPTARAVVEALRPSLHSFKDEAGRELLDLPQAPRPDEDTEAPVRFLPEFDNMLLAYHDRSRFVPATYRGRMVTKNLLIPATFLVDGLVAGSWTVERHKASARLVLNPFGSLSRSSRTALEGEGERLLRFLEPDASRYTV